MKKLTKAEEDVMRYLWQLGQTTVRAIVSEFPEPRPAYNTVSTIVRILESKGFVGHQKQGKGYLYSPIISQDEYKNETVQNLVTNYFQGSFQNMVSFFVKEKNINLKELESILKDINQKNE